MSWTQATTNLCMPLIAAGNHAWILIMGLALYRSESHGKQLNGKLPMGFDNVYPDYEPVGNLMLLSSTMNCHCL